MSWIAGLVPSGHVVDGPTSRLVDLRDPDDARGPTLTAIDLAEVWRVPAFARAAEVGGSFLKTPMVFGLAGLVDLDTDGGRYVYRTGGGRSLAEILGSARAEGKPAGTRAAAELAWLAGAVLVDAADAGALAGVFSHGDVSPWRLLARPEGDLIVVGYGLPEAESLTLRLTPGAASTASAAYAPPERIAGRGEDVRADLFSLALIVAELALGEPIYAGKPEDIRAAAGRAEARKKVAAKSAALPRTLADALSSALATDPADRLAPRAWSATWAAVLGGALSGPSLADLAGRALTKGAPPPPKSSGLAPGATRAFSLDMISAAARDRTASKPAAAPQITPARVDAPPKVEPAPSRAVPPPPFTPAGDAAPHRAAPPAPSAPVSDAAPHRAAPPPPAAPKMEAEPHRAAPPPPAARQADAAPHRAAPLAPAAPQADAVPHRAAPPTPSAPQVSAAPVGAAPQRVAPPAPPRVGPPAPGGPADPSDLPRRAAPPPPPSFAADDAPRRITPPPPPPNFGAGLRPNAPKTKADDDT